MTTTHLNNLTFRNGQLRCENPNHDDDLRGSVTWCNHIRKTIRDGDDAVFLHPGLTIYVPIFPGHDVFAQVIIDGETVGQSALMKMKHVPDMGREIEVHLGFWNPGEGMGSIRLVIIDYLKSKLDPQENLSSLGKIRTKCPNGAHSLRAQRLMEENQNDKQWRWTCLWNIVMEKACTPCIEESGDAVTNNFGVDESIFTKRHGRPF